MNTVSKIRGLAERKGISQAHICKALGLKSRTYLNDVEKRGGTIPEEKLSIIAEILGTTVAYLRGEADEASSQEETLLRIFRAATEEQREKMLSAVKEIANTAH